MSNRPTIPHQLSYSSVSNPNYSRWQGSQRYLIKQPTPYQNNRSYQTDNSDLAFLRNTVGHSSSSQLHKQFSKVNVPPYQPLLRQTSNNFNDLKNNKLQQNNNFYREKRSQTNYENREANQNKQTIGQLGNQGKERLDRIIKKFDKKSQTIQALKLIEELKQLKKKQEELKKQRKGDYQKEQQTINIKAYQPSSPLNFSKKNKVFTQNSPSYQKCQPSTSASSPQNQNLYINSVDVFNISKNIPKPQNTSYIKKQLSPISSNRKYNRTSIQVGNEADFNKTVAETKANYTSPHMYNTFSGNLSGNGYTSSNNVYSPKLTGNYQLDVKTRTYGSTQQDIYKVRDKSPISPYVTKKTYDSPVSNLQKSIHSPRLITNPRQARDKSPNPKLIGSPSSSYTINAKTGLSGSQISSGLSSSQISSTRGKQDLAASLIRRNGADMTSSRSIRDKKYTINDFILGKNLGEGKFGTVFQAMEKKSKALYALKKVPKSIIKSHYMIDQFILQIKIQSFLNHQNILTLNTTFDDAQNVYIMLQYMQQGTLFTHLKKSQKLPQLQASKKLKQISSAVQYLHQNGIAHRDIKPENIVMSHGICKLCDFGWATICDERRKTYCGTFDYAAPEILEGTEYDMSVDLWCLGILAYEILVGKAPFYHISRKETMKKIMNCEHEKINYPSTMSKQARSFIQQLLRKNPEQRLKSQDLLKHPFLKNVDK